MNFIQKVIYRRKYIRQGSKFIFPQLEKKWKKYVKDATKDELGCVIVEDIFKIMQALDEGKSCEEVYNDSSLGGNENGTVISAVAHYSKRGVEWLKWVADNDSVYGLKSTYGNAETIKNMINELEKRNAGFEEGTTVPM